MLYYATKMGATKALFGIPRSIERAFQREHWKSKSRLHEQNLRIIYKMGKSRAVSTVVFQSSGC